MEINGLPAVSVGRPEVLCYWTAMLHDLGDRVETFFEFGVTIGSRLADVLRAVPRRSQLLRPTRRPVESRRRRKESANDEGRYG